MPAPLSWRGSLQPQGSRSDVRRLKGIAMPVHSLTSWLAGIAEVAG